jgi:D-alanyl-D-alanine dipeptidase
MHTFVPPSLQQPAPRAFSMRSHLAPAALALMLASGVHGAQAAVSAPAQPAAAEAALSASRDGGCRETPSARVAVEALAQELRGQGMAFRATCQDASAGWVVQVKVVDGFKASKVVRGPLADGHDVDMGTPAGVRLSGAAPHAQGFSPDVQYNREWLRGVMARHRFEAMPDAWWHFAVRHDAAPKQQQQGETDLAAR